MADRQANGVARVSPQLAPRAGSLRG